MQSSTCNFEEELTAESISTGRRSLLRGACTARVREQILAASVLYRQIATVRNSNQGRLLHLR